MTATCVEDKNQLASGSLFSFHCLDSKDPTQVVRNSEKE